METSRCPIWIAWCAGFAAAAGCSGQTGCSGPQLDLGGGGDSGCLPGTYSGPFDCNYGTDASFPLYPMNGGISFRLQGEPNGKELHIAPGSQLGNDAGGFSSVTTLSGTLDCTTNKLSGNLSNVSFSAGTLSGMFLFSGDFSADYDASSQALVNGQINPMADAGAFPFDAGFPIPDGAIPTITSCAWSATLQP